MIQQRETTVATGSAAIWRGAALATALAFGGCGGGTEDPARHPAAGGSGGVAVPAAVAKAQQAGTAPDPALVAADNAFGVGLLKTLIPTNSGNIAISPLSVSIALQIVWNGAAGSTQTAMAQTLQLGSLSSATLNDDNAALQASLLNADPKVELTIANSLWMNLGNYPVLATFTQADQAYYGATLGDLSGAPDNVNAWIADETRGLIAQILAPEPSSYYQQQIAIIANSIYFKGQWTTAFDPGQTAPGPFTHSDGSEATVSLMHQTGMYPYLQGSWQGTAFQAVQIPYGTGRFGLLVVLPGAGTSISSFVGSLTAGALSSWNAQLQPTPGAIALPRFSATYGTSLVQALSALGMGVAFCASNAADFSALAPGACLSDVEHKTVVEVDETGTIAAGATTVTVSPTVTLQNQFTMTVNHPFVYAIQDERTGELLFIGVMTQP
jgi:serpin B